MSDSTSRKIFKNAIYNYAGFLILVAVQFFSTPYIIRTLGKDAYGVYAIISVFIGYVSLLELGIGASIIKYVSEYYVEKGYYRINKLVSTAFILYLILGLGGTLIILTFREYFAITLFNVPAHLTGDTIFIFTVAGTAFFFTFIFGVYINVLVGLQRMDLTTKISTTFGILNIAGIIMLLWLGYGLMEVVILSSLNGIVGVLIGTYITKRILPEIGLFPRFFDRSLVKNIFQFSLYVFASRVAVLVYQNFGKFIVGIFLPIGYVTIYTVGALLSGFIYRLSGLLVTPVMPASSELIAKRDTDAIKVLFLKGTKYLTIINIAFVALLGVFAEDIIRLWMGEGFEESVIIFQILLIGVFFNTLIHVGGNILPGIGKPHLSAYYAAITTILTVVFTILLIKKFGLVGVAIGSTLEQVITIPIFTYHLCNILNIKFVTFLNHSILKPVLAALPSIIFIIAIKMFFVDIRMEFFIAGIIGFIFIYIIFISYILDKKDKDYLFKNLKNWW